MSWTAAVQGPSATPAPDFYNTIASKLTSWSLDDTVTAANAGTTADCKVWKAPGSDWFLIFEIDDANNRLRVRQSYQYTAASDRVKRYTPNVSAAAATTHKSDYSFDDTDQTIVTAAPT